MYWRNANFDHPVTQTLQGLDLSFHLASSDTTGALSLDYIRTQPQLLVIGEGKVLPTDVSGGDNVSSLITSVIST